MLASINDVQLDTSVLGRSLGYGDIKIMSSSGRVGTDAFTSVQHVEAFKQHVMEAQERLAPATTTASAAPPSAATPAPATPISDRDRCDGDAGQPGPASGLGGHHGRGVRGQEGGAPQPDLRRPRRAELARRTGFEPATFWLRRPTLYPLSYRRAGAGVYPQSACAAVSDTRRRPLRRGAFIAAGFANRGGIFHARFPALPLPKPTHDPATSGESLCEQRRQDIRPAG